MEFEREYVDCDSLETWYLRRRAPVVRTPITNRAGVSQPKPHTFAAAHNYYCFQDSSKPSSSQGSNIVSRLIADFTINEAKIIC